MDSYLGGKKTGGGGNLKQEQMFLINYTYTDWPVNKGSKHDCNHVDHNQLDDNIVLVLKS